jgi:hypothetical protein
VGVATVPITVGIIVDVTLVVSDASGDGNSPAVGVSNDSTVRVLVIIGV